MPEARRLNNTGLVVLGMIAAGRRNGYEIARSIDQSTSFFWPASAGGIYPELRRLHEAGLLGRREDPRGDAARQNYELSPQGRAALQDWLLDETPGRMDMRHEDLLRLFLTDDVSPDKLADLLDRIAAGHEERIRALETDATPTADADRALNRTLALDFGIELNRASAAWCRDTATRLRTQAS